MDNSEASVLPSPTWANQGDNRISRQPVDLTNCDREPVQFPGAIMPQGVLLILSLSDFRIQGASANTVSWFGTDAAQLLHGQLDLIFTPNLRQVLELSLIHI